jgi:serine/threonine protein kinase
MDQPDRTAPETATAASATGRAAPRTVGRYEILEEIGRGGMGVVYKARQPDLDRLVALKQLHSIHASAPELVHRFVRESRLAGSLNHPNIVTVHDYLAEDGISYIAMEYVPRGSLRPWIGHLSLAQLAGVLEGLLAGLAAVEPSGIVHRDLKPENVMVSDDGRVKIADFGVAKAIQSADVVSFQTITGTTVGTPAYMAPEQALSEEIGPWTDLYSVGVMAYEQLVGQLPFHDSPSPMAILLRHLKDPIPPVIDSRPDLDPALSEWVARLLVKEPHARTASAALAWDELEEIVLELLGSRWRREARLPQTATSTSGTRPPTRAPLERERDAGSSAPTPSAVTPAASPESTPELESGFLSYGRTPTGAEMPKIASPKPPRTSGTPTPERLAGPRQRSASSSSQQALARSGRLGDLRMPGLAVLLAALMGVAGFALAPAGSPTAASTGSTASVERARAASRLYAAKLSGAISKLNAVQASAGSELAHAGSAHTQALAAQRLADAHAAAAATVRAISPQPSVRAANAAIASALARVAEGYSAMASAARREAPRDFDRSRTAVNRATGTLVAVLAQLSSLGYKLGD